MKSEKFQKEMTEIQNKIELETRAGDTHRARSVTVGTCFGGVTEIMMRGNNGYLWSPMQPVEVVELINQLAANIGCNIALKPKKDFASWREWRLTEEEKNHLNGFPPFSNDMAPFMQVGANGMDKELDILLSNGAKVLESGGGAGGSVLNYRSNQDAVATKKTVNRRSTKRTAKAA